MKALFKLFTVFASFTILVTFLSGCATKRPEGKTEAEVLYREAFDLMDKGRYLLATERLNTLRSQYPYSYYSTHAELLQADILFKQENFVEASAAYILFKDFHPKHKDVPYVIWKIGESFFNQLPSTYDRDLTPGLEAKKYYQELIQRYGDSKHKKEAVDKSNHIDHLLEQKEKYIADFYFKTEVFDAARYRYLDIIKNFKSAELVEHSAQRVVISSFHLGDYKNCVSYSDEYLGRVGESARENISDFKNRCKENLK